jgi:Do/DeqQ family serine protease
MIIIVNFFMEKNCKNKNNSKLSLISLIFTGFFFTLSAQTEIITENIPNQQPLVQHFVDFTHAAEQSVNSVVHVKTKYKISYPQGGSDYFNDLFEFFFGRPQNPRRNEEPIEQPGGSGSGVIISEDGYIVTNNHVIDKTSSIEITLNDKRTFKAEVVGSDPATDIALLKIDASDLPPIPIGNSDLLRVGEWVLAVGNPFNLASTVTAGIVSAKARNINILSADLKIESFIQTDAAVNQGNSGGALVNTKGELVGINTAIASQTGQFIGYSFAVPVSIVNKVVYDLKEFGVVQRAVLGVQTKDIDAAFAKEKKLPTLEGVYVENVIDKGAAKNAGIKEGDIITAIENVKVNSMAELQEQVGRYRPGDHIQITAIRNGKEQIFEVELRNRSGSTGVVKAVDLAQLGAKFQPINSKTKYKFGINGGLEVTSVDKNGRFAKAGIQKGYIILRANKKIIHSEDDLYDVCEQIKNEEDEDVVLLLTGTYPNGQVVYFAVDLNE